MNSPRHPSARRYWQGQMNDVNYKYLVIIIVPTYFDGFSKVYILLMMDNNEHWKIELNYPVIACKLKIMYLLIFLNLKRHDDFGPDLVLVVSTLTWEQDAPSPSIPCVQRK